MNPITAKKQEAEEKNKADKDSGIVDAQATEVV
jgi:hypothetical protein